MRKVGRPSPGVQKVKFNDIISDCDMVHLVTGPTHTAGHTLDVFIMQSSTSVKVNIDLPVYSDHSLITAEIRTGETMKTIYDIRTISKRDWTRVDFEAFEQDLLLSMLSPIHQSTPTIFLSAMMNVFGRL